MKQRFPSFLVAAQAARPYFPYRVSTALDDGVMGALIERFGGEAFGLDEGDITVNLKKHWLYQDGAVYFKDAIHAVEFKLRFG